MDVVMYVYYTFQETTSTEKHRVSNEVRFDTVGRKKFKTASGEKLDPNS